MQKWYIFYPSNSQEKTLVCNQWTQITCLPAGYSKIKVCLCETSSLQSEHSSHVQNEKHLPHALNRERQTIRHSEGESLKALHTVTGVFSYTSWLNLLSDLSVHILYRLWLTTACVSSLTLHNRTRNIFMILWSTKHLITLVNLKRSSVKFNTRKDLLGLVPVPSLFWLFYILLVSYCTYQVLPVNQEEIKIPN